MCECVWNYKSVDRLYIHTYVHKEYIYIHIYIYKYIYVNLSALFMQPGDHHVTYCACLQAPKEPGHAQDVPKASEMRSKAIPSR